MKQQRHKSRAPSAHRGRSAVRALGPASVVPQKPLPQPMGSDNTKSRRGGKAGLPKGRLLVLFLGLVFLFWNTTEPASKPDAAAKVPRARKLIADRAEVSDTVPVAREEGTAQVAAALPEGAEVVAAKAEVSPFFNNARGLYRFSAVDIDGVKRHLDEFMGKARLRVAAASRQTEAHTHAGHAGGERGVQLWLHGGQL